MNRKITRYVLPIMVVLLFAGCQTGWQGEDRDFRQDMRDFVQSISSYAKSSVSGFIIIPQNGHALVTADGQAGGAPAAAYLSAIDGVGREDLYYGYDNDNVATTAIDRDEIIPFLDTAKANGVEILVTDYVSDQAKVDNSYSANNAKGYISFAADSRDLDTIPGYPPAPYLENTASVSTLVEAANFLYLLDPTGYSPKTAYLSALAATDYDAIILDLFYEDGAGVVTALSAADLASIAKKPGGEDRLLICYMSIGEAEDYRYYWDPSWAQNPPAWLEEENPLWKGNYKVQYWNTDWQAVIFGGTGAYLDKIIAAGFDGVYLDIIDAYEYFEG